MFKKIRVKPVINKNNGQINVSLPRRQLPKDFIKDLNKIKDIKLSLEGWEK